MEIKKLEIKYSVDMIRIFFRIKSDYIQCFMYDFGFDNDVDNYQSSLVSSCQYNYSVNLEEGKSFYIGFCPNWLRDSFERKTHGILEFNPNKVSKYPRFKKLFNELVLSATEWKMVRYDLAIDIPVDRQYVVLLKDQRKYGEVSYSNSNRTQYLGVKNSPGYVKVYNKQIESKLDNVLTRVEITCEYMWDMEEINDNIPRLLYVGDLQLDISLDGTDKVLFLSCLEHPEYLQLLGRRKKEKISSHLEKIRFDDDIFLTYKNYSIIRQTLDAFTRVYM